MWAESGHTLTKEQPIAIGVVVSMAVVPIGIYPAVHESPAAMVRCIGGLVIEVRGLPASRD